ncbi:Retrotransposon-derived protein [Trichinella pseudospiralis]
MALPQLVSQLPKNIQSRWKIQCGKSALEPTSQTFLDFLAEQARCAVDPVQSTHGEKISSPTHKHTLKENQRKRSRPPRQTIGAFHTSLHPTCPVCQGEHRVTVCPQFLNQQCSERRATAARMNMCFICLTKGHRADRCKFKHRGWRTHHLLISSAPKKQTPLPEGLDDTNAPPGKKARLESGEETTTRALLANTREKCERISQTCSHSIDVIKINNLEKLTEEELPTDVEVRSIFTEVDFFCDFQRLPTLTRNSHKSCFTCSNDATYCLRSTFSGFLENEVHCGARKRKSKGFHNFLRGNIVDIPRWPHSQRMVDNVYIPKATYSLITVLDGVHPFDNGNGFQKIPLNEAYMKNKLFLNRMHFYQLWEFELENLEMARFYPEVANQQAVENEKLLQLELQKRRLRLVKVHLPNAS